MHNRNPQILATEMFKADNNITSPIFTEIFNDRNLNYQLRHILHFSIPSVRSVYNGTESLSFLGLEYCAKRVERSDIFKRF